jgi:hypothetical protein
MVYLLSLIITNNQRSFQHGKGIIWWDKQCQAMGEITIKRARGAKVKVLFQGLHMTCVIFMLVYNLKLSILDTPFKTTF